MLKDELRNLQEELNGKEAIIEGLNREIDRIETEKLQIQEELHSVIAVKQVRTLFSINSFKCPMFKFMHVYVK